jgi:hypothetical protein
MIGMISTGFQIGLNEILVVALLIGLPIISLIDLARRKLTGIPLAIWAVFICVVPIMGSVAYWIIRPSGESKA